MRSTSTDDGTGESASKSGLAIFLTGLMLFSVLTVPGVAGAVAANGAGGPAATSGSTQASAAADAAAVDTAATDAAATSDVGLQVSIGKGSFEPGKSYQSDATVNIAVSAVDTSGTLPEPVSGVDMTISVIDPNGQVTNFTRTSTDGAVSVQYSLEGRTDGRYTVRATSSNASVTSGQASFDAGPVIDFYPDYIDAKIEVGRQTQITMGATAGGVPVSGVSRTVTISKGFFGDETTRTVTTGANGFATINYTADTTGEYRISTESSAGSTSLRAVEAFADVDTNGPAFGRVDGGETVYFTGRLIDDAAPLSSEPITVRIVNESAFPVQQMTNLSTTTDAFGQFVVSWQTPDTSGKSYKAQIYDSNGDRITYDGGTVFTRFEDGGFFDGGDDGGTDGTTTSIETSLDVTTGAPGALSGPSQVVTPGQTVGATVTPRVDGQAQANKDVSYALTYGFGGAVIESGTVTTNGSGVATLQFTVPESAPDDADLNLGTAATLNGNVTEGFGGAAIQDYRVTATDNNPFSFSGFFGSPSIFSGQSTGYTFSFTDVPTGDPVEGSRAMVVGEGTDRFHATSFDPQAVTSNASGLATASIDIPETVTGTVWREPRYRYWTGVSSGREVSAYNVTIEGLSGKLTAGETATLSYTTDSETTASGILVVATFNESVDTPVVAARRLDPGQSTSVTFPDLAYNVSYTAQVTSINDRALTATASKSVGVLGSGSDGATDADGAVGRVGFDYVNQGGSVNLEVNGDREYNASSFSALDGTTVGGVSVSVTTSASNAGHVELDGPVDTFAVGGQETSVDNIEFGAQSNVTANVTFDSVSPSQSSYGVGDSLTADGVPAQIIDFTFTDGTDYQQGSASLNTGSVQPPGGSAPSLFPSNVNVWFNVTDVVEQAGESDAIDFGIELQQEATVSQGGSVDIDAFPNNRLDSAVSDATLELVVDQDRDGVFDSSEVVASKTVDFAAGETRTETFTYSNVQLDAGQYEYRAQISKDGQQNTSFTTGTLTVESDDEVAGAVGRVGFDYVNQGGSVNLEVNGDREYNVSSFSAMDGMIVGGVGVSVTTSASNAGHVELDGPVDTFAVGGQETSVDNIEFGAQSNVAANVTFDNVSPSQPSYTVGDSLTADGVPAQIIDFTFTDGTDYQQGSATLNNGSIQPPGGSAPSLFPSNVNVWFNVTDVVEQTGDDTGGGAGPSRSAPDTVTPGGSATVTLQTNVSDSSVTFQEAFSPPFNSTSITSVTVNGNQASPFLQAADSSGIVVTLQGLTPGDRVTVTYEVSVSSNAQTGTDYDIEGNVTSATTASLPTDTIAVQQGSPLSGVAGQYDSDFDGDIDIQELGQAAADYARGNLNIAELGSVAAVYARS